MAASKNAISKVTVDIVTNAAEAAQKIQELQSATTDAITALQEFPKNAKEAGKSLESSFKNVSESIIKSTEGINTFVTKLHSLDAESKAVATAIATNLAEIQVNATTIKGVNDLAKSVERLKEAGKQANFSTLASGIGKVVKAADNIKKLELTDIDQKARTISNAIGKFIALDKKTTGSKFDGISNIVIKPVDATEFFNSLVELKTKTETELKKIVDIAFDYQTIPINLTLGKITLPKLEDKTFQDGVNKFREEVKKAFSDGEGNFQIQLPGIGFTKFNEDLKKLREATATQISSFRTAFEKQIAELPPIDTSEFRKFGENIIKIVKDAISASEGVQKIAENFSKLQNIDLKVSLPTSKQFISRLSAIEDAINAEILRLQEVFSGGRTLKITFKNLAVDFERVSFEKLDEKIKAKLKPSTASQAITLSDLTVKADQSTKYTVDPTVYEQLGTNLKKILKALTVSAEQVDLYLAENGTINSKALATALKAKLKESPLKTTLEVSAPIKVLPTNLEDGTFIEKITKTITNAVKRISLTGLNIKKLSVGILQENIFTNSLTDSVKSKIKSSTADIEATMPATMNFAGVAEQAQSFTQLSSALNGIASKLNAITGAEEKLAPAMSAKNAALERQVALFKDLASLSEIPAILNATSKVLEASVKDVNLDFSKAKVTLSADSKRFLEEQIGSALKNIKSDLSKLKPVVELNASIKTTVKMLDAQAGVFTRVQNAANGMMTSLEQLSSSELTLSGVIERENSILSSNSKALENIEKLANATKEVLKSYATLVKSSGNEELKPVDISGVLSSVEQLTQAYTGIVNASTQIRESQNQMVNLAKEAIKALEREEQILKRISETAVNAAKVANFKKSTSVKIIDERDVEKEIIAMRRFTTSIESAKKSLDALKGEQLSVFSTNINKVTTNATTLKEALAQIAKSKSNLSKLLSVDVADGIKAGSIASYDRLIDKVKEYTSLIIRSNEATADTNVLLTNQQNLLNFQKAIVSNVLQSLNSQDEEYKIIEKDLDNILKQHRQVLDLEVKEFKNESDIATAMKERTNLITQVRQQMEALRSKQKMFDIGSNEFASLNQALRVLSDIESMMIASATATSLFEKDLSEASVAISNYQKDLVKIEGELKNISRTSINVIKAGDTDKIQQQYNALTRFDERVQSLKERLLEVSKLPGFNIPIESELESLNALSDSAKAMSATLMTAFEESRNFSSAQKQIMESSKLLSGDLDKAKKALDGYANGLKKVAESKVSIDGRDFIINPKKSLDSVVNINAIKEVDVLIRGAAARAAELSKLISSTGTPNPATITELKRLLDLIAGLTAYSKDLKQELNELQKATEVALPQNLTSNASKTSSAVDHLSESLNKLGQSLAKISSEQTSAELLNKLRESTKQAASSINTNISTIQTSFSILSNSINSVVKDVDANPIKIKVLESGNILPSLTTLKSQLSDIRQELQTFGQSTSFVDSLITSIEGVSNASLTADQRMASMAEFLNLLKTRSGELQIVLGAVTEKINGLHLEQSFKEMPGQLDLVTERLRNIEDQTKLLNETTITLAKTGTHLELQQLIQELKNVSKEANTAQKEVEKMAQAFFSSTLKSSGKESFLKSLTANKGELKSQLEQSLGIKIDISNAEQAYKTVRDGFLNLKNQISKQSIDLKINTDEATKSLKSTSSFARAIEEATGLRATMRAITEEGSLLSRAVERYFATVANSIKLSSKSTQDYIIGLRELEDELIRLRSGVVTWSMGVMMLGQMISAPIVKAINDFTEFGDTMGMVQGITGATNAEMEKLVHTSLAFTSVTRFFPQQAAEGLRELAKAGFSANDALSALPTVLRMAQAASFSVGESAAITTHLMHTFSMSLEEVGTATDILVKAANSSTATVSDLGYSFTYVGAIANGFGVSLQETIAAIANLHNAGFKGSMAGTALRGMLDSLFNPTKDEADMIQELSDRIGGTGLQLRKANGDFVGFVSIIQQLEKAGLKSEEALRLFGQRAGPGAAAMMRLGSDKLKQLNQDLEFAGGTAAEMADVMQNTLKGSFLLFASAVQGLMHDMANNLAVPLKTVTDFATDFVLAIKHVHEALGPVAVVIDTLAASIAGLLAIIGSMTFTWFLVIVPFVQFVGLINTFVKVTKAGTDQLIRMGQEAKKTAGAIQDLNTAQRTRIITSNTSVKPGDVGSTKNVTQEQIQKANTELAKQLQLINGNKSAIHTFSTEAITAYLHLDEGAKKYLVDLQEIRAVSQNLKSVQGLKNLLPPGTAITATKLEAAITAIKAKIQTLGENDPLKAALQKDLAAVEALHTSMTSLSSDSHAKLSALNLELIAMSGGLDKSSVKVKEFVNVLRTASPAALATISAQIKKASYDVDVLSADLKALGLKEAEIDKLTLAFKELKAATAAEKAELRSLLGKMSALGTQGKVAGSFATSGSTLVSGGMDVAMLLNGMNSMKGIAPVVSAELMTVASSAGFLIFTLGTLGAALKDIAVIIGTYFLISLNSLGKSIVKLTALIGTFVASFSFGKIAAGIKAIGVALKFAFTTRIKNAITGVGNSLKALGLTTGMVSLGFGALIVAVGLAYLAYRKFTEVERSRDELVKLQEESEVLKKYSNDVKSATADLQDFIASKKALADLEAKGIQLELKVDEDADKALNDSIVSHFQKLEKDFNNAKENFEDSLDKKFELTYVYNPDSSIKDLILTTLDVWGNEVQTKLISMGTPDPVALEKALDAAAYMFMEAQVRALEKSAKTLGTSFKDLFSDTFTADGLVTLDTEHTQEFKNFLDTNKELFQKYLMSLGELSQGFEFVDLDQAAQNFLDLVAQGADLEKGSAEYETLKKIIKGLANEFEEVYVKNKKFFDNLEKIKDIKESFAGVKRGVDSLTLAITKLEKENEDLAKKFTTDFKDMLKSLDAFAKSRSNLAKFGSDIAIKEIDREADARLAALELQKDSVGVYETEVTKILVDSVNKRNSVLSKATAEEFKLRESAMKQLEESLQGASSAETDKARIDSIQAFIAAAKNQASAYQSSIESMIDQTKKLNKAIDAVKKNSEAFAEKIQASINEVTRSPFDFFNQDEIAQAQTDALAKVAKAREAMEKGQAEKAVKYAEEAYEKLKSVEGKVSEGFNSTLKGKFKELFTEVGELHKKASGAVTKSLEGSKATLQGSINNLSSKLEELVNKITAALTRITEITAASMKNATVENGMVQFGKDALEAAKQIGATSQAVAMLKQLAEHIDISALEKLKSFEFLQDININKGSFNLILQEMIAAVNEKSEEAFTTAQEKLLNFVNETEPKLQELQKQLTLKLSLETDEDKKAKIAKTLEEVKSYLDQIEQAKDNPFEYDENKLTDLLNGIQALQDASNSVDFSNLGGFALEGVKEALGEIKAALRDLNPQELLDAKKAVQDLIDNAAKLNLPKVYVKALSDVLSTINSLVEKTKNAKDAGSRLDLPASVKEKAKEAADAVGEIESNLKKSDEAAKDASSTFDGLGEGLDKAKESAEDLADATKKTQEEGKKAQEVLGGLEIDGLVAQLRFNGLDIQDFEAFKEYLGALNSESQALFDKLQSLYLPPDFLGLGDLSSRVQITFADIWTSVNSSVEELSAKLKLDLRLDGINAEEAGRMIMDINQALQQLAVTEAETRYNFKNGLIDQEGLNLSLGKIDELKQHFYDVLNKLQSDLNLGKIEVDDSTLSALTNGINTVKDQIAKDIDVKPTVTVEQEKVQKEVDSINVILEGIQSYKEIEIDVIDNATDKINDLIYKLNELKDVQINLSATQGRHFGGMIGDAIQHFATGGQALSFSRPSYSVVPGSGEGDKVPAMLEPGEFIIRKDAVRKLGTNFLYALNSGVLQFRQLGGLISSAGSTFKSSMNFDPSAVVGYNSGGLVNNVVNESSGSSKDTVDVRLQVGDSPKKFSMQSDRDTANELLKVLKNLQ